MNNYFKKEDHRKNQLFSAWKIYLHRIHAQLIEIANCEDFEFEEIYEDLVTVTHVSKNCVNLQLDSGERILNLNLGPEICKHTRRLDSMFMALGFYKNRWWPLEVLTMASPLTSTGEFHMSVNPDYIENQELEVLQ